MASANAGATELKTSIPNRFNYVYSCDLDVNIEVKICHLEGSRPKKDFKEVISDSDAYLREYESLSAHESEKEGSHLYVTCQIYAYDKAISLPIQTKYCYYKSSSIIHAWNEWLKLPLRYCDIPRNSVLAITVWDIFGCGEARPIGGTTLPLFGKYGTFRQGQRDLTVWADKKADGNTNTTTPSKVRTSENMESTRLIKLAKKHKDGHIPKVDWMDRMVFREIELIRDKENKKPGSMFLMIEFQEVKHHDIIYTIAYFEENSDAALQVRAHPQMILLPDHDLNETNLVEEKHRKLVRSLRAGQHELKPNAATRDLLAMIIQYPPSKQLTSEEEDYIWKFRYYLSSQKKALTKFLGSVKWEGEGERNVALQLLDKWQPIDVSDALELLSPRFTNPTVRSYAVKRLSEAPDDDLVLYLLQLVQALKYENFDNIKQGYELAKKQDARNQKHFQSSTSSENYGLEEAEQEGVPSTGAMNAPEELDLATFLIKRACKNSNLANYFYWYLLVECDEQNSADPEKRRASEMYITVMKRFSYSLLRGDRQCRLRRSQLAGQQKFIDKLVNLIMTVQKDNSNRKRKIDKLRALLANSEPNTDEFNFQSFDPLPLPLDPEIKVCGILADRATLYKSALMPAKLTFLCSDKTTFTTIYKNGDDLRQDQLILQIIRLMDRLLQKENLDLKLTPFKVLPTSSKHGFVEYVESKSVAEVLATEGSIQDFFRKYHPNNNHPYGIDKTVMDTYIKSCAGYCVITYLLGIGDRHLDNLLLINNGKLFHVDFGYILGRDPKPLPPPMKLSKEMVEGMGGVNSDHYQEFRKHCYTAFLHLRRHANLILNLFSLMTDASVPDIALEPDKTVKKVQDKFCLELSDEEAVHHMQGLIDESVNAMFAAVVEQIHKVAQYWRK